MTFQPFPAPGLDARKIRVVCVGGGLMGIHFAGRMREFGKGIDFQIYERNSEPGGTWVNNRYPGVACDVPSFARTFPGAPFPDWSRFQAPGSDCQKYALFVAKKYHFYDYARFGVDVKGAKWDDDKGKWIIKCSDLKTGEEFVDEAEVLINATGLLSFPRYPELPGLRDYKGIYMHTADWKDGTDLAGKKIALVGSGASALQALPPLQKAGAHVHLYAKSPTWVVPLFSAPERDRFWGFKDSIQDGEMSEDPERVNPVYTEEQKKLLREDPVAMQQHRNRIAHSLNELFHGDLAVTGSPLSVKYKDLLTKFAEAKLGGREDLKQFFIPHFAPACRRPTPAPGFFPAVTAPNVTVIASKAVDATAKGLVDQHGVEREHDIIVFATGFWTDFAACFPIEGRNGFNTASDKWRNDPKSYMVCNYPDSPNMFCSTGPFLNSLGGDYLVGQEKIADYIVKCILKLQRHRYKSMVAKPQAIEDWCAYADSWIRNSVHTENCSAWYKNGTVDKPVRALWPGNVLHTLEIMQEPQWEDFDFERLPGEETGPARFNWVGNGHGRRETESNDYGYYMPLVKDIYKETPAYGDKDARVHVP